MTKSELEQAIKNGESVWYADDCNEKVWEINLNEKYKPEIYLDQILYIYQNINDRFKQELFIKNIYKTKAEAEHYLHHANVTHIETLPFLTWEEFKQKEYFEFFNGNKGFMLYISHTHNENIRIITYGRYNPDGNVLFEIPQTEENFYKVYDEAVKLFKGEKQ